VADALATLRRLRQIEADQARRALAAALAASLEAERRAQAARTALQTEARAAPVDAGHPLAGSYAAWLPTGQTAVREAAAAERIAQTRADATRAALAEARAAERAVETVLDARAAARHAASLRREQVELDDFKPTVAKV
jgi:flagellar biosynthesis chaperone FliJ